MPFDEPIIPPTQQLGEVVVNESDSVYGATAVDIQQSREGDSVYDLTTVTFSQKGSSLCLDLSSVDGYGLNKARTISSAA